MNNRKTWERILMWSVPPYVCLEYIGQVCKWWHWCVCFVCRWHVKNVTKCFKNRKMIEFYYHFDQAIQTHPRMCVYSLIRWTTGKHHRILMWSAPLYVCLENIGQVRKWRDQDRLWWWYVCLRCRSPCKNNNVVVLLVDADCKLNICKSCREERGWYQWGCFLCVLTAQLK